MDPIGLQVGVQTCNAGLQPECDGLQPLAVASNLGSLVCLALLVFLVTDLLAMPPHLVSMASNLRARLSNFDCFSVSFLVTNLLAMAPQPALDGPQPKSDDLQLTCFVLLKPFSPPGFRVACGNQIRTRVNKCVNFCFQDLDHTKEFKST